MYTYIRAPICNDFTLRTCTLSHSVSYSLRMRTQSLLLVCVGVSAMVGLWACASDTVATDEVDVSALTDDQLALKALQILGAKQLPGIANYGVPGVVGEGACASCHSINQRQMAEWQTNYNEQLGPEGLLRNAATLQNDKINSLRRDPGNNRTRFAPNRIGFASAGVHLGLGANVIPAKHPFAHAQGTFFAELFKNKASVYDSFRRQMLMPVENSHARLTPSEYETVFTWLSKGMPEANKYIPEPTQPTTCVENFTGLRAHAIAIKSSNWSTYNRDEQIPMFACPSLESDPLTCFQQKKSNKDIFPLARDTAFGRNWEKEGSSARIVRKLGYDTSFWMRTSADGRFVANGGGPQGEAVIEDMAPQLTGAPAREINVSDSYDPDFFPDNKGFMFPGNICPQSLLTNPLTTQVSLNEPGCSSSSADLYQTIGQVVGDNSIADRFVISSTHANDAGNDSGGGDHPMFADITASITIHPFRANANDAAGGYKELPDVAPVSTPFRGDAMVSRSGKLVATRIAAAGGGNNNANALPSLGYQLDTMTATKSGDSYRFTLREAGKICVQGNKANLSFDERFLTSQHYLPATNNGGTSSEIWVADFVTGKTVVALKMNPGQNAKYPHFRSDGWLYVLVDDSNTGDEYVVASDIAIRAAKAAPTP